MDFFLKFPDCSHSLGCLLIFYIQIHHHQKDHIFTLVWKSYAIDLLNKISFELVWAAVTLRIHV